MSNLETTALEARDSSLFSSLHPQLPKMTSLPVRRALDLGCGDRPIFADRQVAQSQVGADIYAVRIAEPFVSCRGRALPFADASFDLVVARVSIPYMHIPKAAGEISRVLRPSGCLWATLHLPRMALKRIRMALRRADFVDVVLQSYALLNCGLTALGRMQLPWIDGTYESVQTPGGIHRSLMRAGFSSVATEICPDDGGRLHFAVMARKAA